MALGIQLERVRKKVGGRVHLTPHVPESGDVRTLCSLTFAAGSYRATEEEADCRPCLRRRDDPARVSSAFFQSEVGSELLQISLQQARARRAERPAAKAPPGEERPVPAPPEPGRRPVPEEPEPRLPELRSSTRLRRTFEGVYVSPQGVVLRVGKDGRLREVAFSGPVDLRRREGMIVVQVGDVELEL